LGCIAIHRVKQQDATIQRLVRRSWRIAELVIWRIGKNGGPGIAQTKTAFGPMLGVSVGVVAFLLVTGLYYFRRTETVVADVV